MKGPARYQKGPMPSLSSIFSQMWPPRPEFNLADLPDLTGKVYLVTGGSGGVGEQVVRMLYAKNARVYIGARSREKASRVIKEAQDDNPSSKGCISFLYMDFMDLETIKAGVEQFRRQETSLHTLFNNAAVQSSGPTKTTQGWEIHFGVNVLAPFLLTHLLTSTLLDTAKLGDDVRVVWVGSLSIELLGERSRAISRDYLEYWPTVSALERYGITKAAAWLHGSEMAKRFPDITSITCNPGHLRSELYRDQHRLLRGVLNTVVLYPAELGAYTELVAGVSSTIKKSDSGRWMIPWGRWGEIRKDLIDATSLSADGGRYHAQEFWDWCLEQVSLYI